MATNGLSAQQWLNANQAHLTPIKVMKIRENILKKLQTLAEDSGETAGLIEALDVIDSWLQLAATPEHQKPNQHNTSSHEPVLPTGNEKWDLTPLIPEVSSKQQALSANQKQQAFTELLKNNPYPLSETETPHSNTSEGQS
ncbi:hypothetical protein [Zooshikella ganghwensis]|uniref:hypothetical protein n=1 Tax=Zooshikella ganghwensis TaxID=202772 RepID=UPI0003FA4E3D|nr:hypothetical protein [Zooshikella ganghwensis]